jgi:hypothetical protein
MRGRSRHLDGTGITSLLLNQSQRGFIKSIQAGTITIASGATSNTGTVTAVDPNNSVLIFLGNELSGSTDPRTAYARIELTNATTITATRNTSAANTNACNYVLIEFRPGVIKSVQRGTITASGAVSNTATITAVNTAKAWVMLLGWTTTGATDGTTRIYFCRATLTDATTVTFRRNEATSACTGSYQVVEFY